MAAGHASIARLTSKPTPFKLHQLLFDVGSHTYQDVAANHVCYYISQLCFCLGSYIILILKSLVIMHLCVAVVHMTHQLNRHLTKILDGEWIIEMDPGDISLPIKLRNIFMILNLWLDFILGNGTIIIMMNNPINIKQIIKSIILMFIW